MKSSYSLKFLIVIALFSISSTILKADILRCGNKIVNEGATTIEVKLICGQPFDSEFIGLVKLNNAYVNVDRYTYVFGKGKFAMILEFHDGELVKISNGPRM
ncbi:DUF2845 domain-containing protein [Brumicola pallidula]|jgi:hypothetical protein|uniref:DUF2845 domain-containing protein n=1 Tax=Brumicola pallidula DSM 14239 = ACAM 615 TaxID=1121922 RepID=K6YST2_9ALTE|nr:DUF2845 domain-containing protein [Glaciecola pallidula]GAC27036.1 hypothetical protein GPAL_0155 [Glaciecola pallidula DSM 14239 = ACAM 615]